MKVQSFDEAVERYGQIDLTTETWANEDKWCRIVHVPEAISDHLINSLTKTPCVKIYCNKDMAIALERVFDDLVAEDLAHILRTYDGCYCIRKVRNRNTVSAHAYALAIDFDAQWNELGYKGEMNLRVVNIFTRYGFDWGGFFTRPDGMHFSYCWEG